MATRHGAGGARLTKGNATPDQNEATLFACVADVCGGPVRSSTQTSGGNCARSWAIDIEAPNGLREVFLRYATTTCPTPTAPSSWSTTTPARQLPV